jgi:hypothetical protein
LALIPRKRPSAIPIRDRRSQSHMTPPIGWGVLHRPKVPKVMRQGDRLADLGSQRQGDLRGKAHLEPLLSPVCKEGLPSFAPRSRKTAGLLPTLSMMRLCPSIHTFPHERLPSGHSSEQATTSRPLARAGAHACELNHYTALSNRLPCLAPLARKSPVASRKRDLSHALAPLRSHASLPRARPGGL